MQSLVHPGLQQPHAAICFQRHLSCAVCGPRPPQTDGFGAVASRWRRGFAAAVGSALWLRARRRLGPDGGEREDSEDFGFGSTWDQLDDVLTEVAPESEAKLPRQVPKILLESYDLVRFKLQLDRASAFRLALALQRQAVEKYVEDPAGTRTTRVATRFVEDLLRFPEARQRLAAELSAESEGAGLKLEGTLQFLAELKQRRSTESRTNHPAPKPQEGGSTELQVDPALRPWWMKEIEWRAMKWVDIFFGLSPWQKTKPWPSWVVPASTLPPGWQKATVQGKTMFWNPARMKYQFEAPAPPGSAAAPSHREPPVQLLDVGAGSISFSGFGHLVSAHAIDRKPPEGRDDVLKADFLTIPLVSRPEGADGLSFIRGPDGDLQGIVEGSFDVVVLSRVLSFQSDPGARIAMVERARRCLSDDRGLLLVIEAGVVLAGGKQPLDEWESSIESAGFTLIRFITKLLDESLNEQKDIFLWAFQTAPVGSRALPLRIASDYKAKGRK